MNLEGEPVSILTVDLPEDLALRLAAKAAAERKTAQQVVVEKLRASLGEEGSPRALLETLRSLPPLSADDVAALEKAIESGRLPAAGADFSY
jgi:hypothetical protein